MGEPSSELPSQQPQPEHTGMLSPANTIPSDGGIPLPQPLNPEMAAALAEHCAETADEIVHAVLAQPPKHVPWYAPASILHRYKPSGDFTLKGYTDTIRGMGESNSKGQTIVKLSYSPSYATDNPEAYGSAPYFVSVSRFTDAQTYPAIAAMFERGEVSSEFMYTHYHVDRNGHHTKVIQLPVDFPDDRPVLSSDEWYKSVQAEMTPEDFELLGGALEFLKGRVAFATEHPDWRPRLTESVA